MADASDALRARADFQDALEFAKRVQGGDAAAGIVDLAGRGPALVWAVDWRPVPKPPALAGGAIVVSGTQHARADAMSSASKPA